MTTGTFRGRERARRGVILILVLGVLGLMAVIGVTFATYSGQARIAARSFAQSKVRPQGEALVDFALSQLICDTNDVRSAIRGHSLARDMYGNDGRYNGLVERRSDGARMAPNNDALFYITAATQDGTYPEIYHLTTNIPDGDPLFYGYDFTRWTIKVASPPVDASTRVINQSFEVVNDSQFVPGGTGSRVLQVVIRPEDANAQIYNPSYPGGALTTITPAYRILNGVTGLQFTLDGRWLHAFNGPGRTDQAKYGNFRYNLDDPATRGMDEDYDAVDLENWFLAMQSADGQVMIPSFHRPAIVRHDLTGTTDIDNADDWTNVVDPMGADPALALRNKISRILRPRQADGNDAATFPDLIPDATTGRITYDVDNDGDGLNDSVWLDLGYPARRNAQGKLYKPLFAFMVIGLNGRIPLNTAGNMAARGGATGDEPQSSHAAHLGNSVSEIDPSYGLQNAYKQDTGIFGDGYTQVDSSLVDVRLNQLRNLLAGTRPQPDPYKPDTTGQVNGDTNWVGMGTSNLPYFMPNGQADNGDIDVNGISGPPTGNVVRLTPAVPGRWGEPDSVPGGNYAPLQTTYVNEVRPGYSISVKDIVSGSYRPLDSADDDYNSFDAYPIPDAVTGARMGEIGDFDYYDASGSLFFPIERIRRFVAPIDVNGSGRVARFNGGGTQIRGGDVWGRVEYRGYFRPPGLPGQIDPATGVVSFAPFVAGNPYPNLNATAANVAAATAHNNNILHGFESFLQPNTKGTPQRSGGLLAYKQMSDSTNTATYLVPGNPTELPTYNGDINSGTTYSFTTPDDSGADVSVTINSRSDGLNEADEMNLYNPDPLLDSPFGFADLEWLYRSHDVDGGSLSSRLAQLAPISFSNAIDGLRRRRLYSIDVWESNAFAWANDNPLGAFGLLPDSMGNPTRGGNSTFAPVANAGMLGATYTPGLAQRGRKINLNMPLPVSNDPQEPIRRKWIADAYQLMKTVLPPRAIDTPEERAKLGQFLVNVIDFRDPDCTMTIWDNPDVFFVPSASPTAPPTLSFAGSIPLRHYGMEYNPVAINEVLAFSYGRKNGTTAGTGINTGRFFIELANTLSQAEGNSDVDHNASTVNLSGYNTAVPPNQPYDGACWDLVFTGDAVGSRPDPFSGQLQPGAQIYGVTPLGGGALTGAVKTAATTTPAAAPVTEGVLARALPRQTTGTPPPIPLTVVGFVHPDAANESKSEHPLGAGGAGNTWTASPSFTGSNKGVLYELNTAWDPFNNTVSGFTFNPGVLPNDAAGNQVTTLTATQIPRAAGAGAYYWVHLRRPANPMLAVSADNPMVVVDSMRFPYVDVGGTAQTMSSPSPTGSPNRVDKVTKSTTPLYSYQRMQPYRGGQAVPWNPTTGGAIDPRYGYTEQIATSVQQIGTMAVYFGDNNTQRDDSTSTDGQVSNVAIYNTLGQANDGTTNEYWDWFPFHDRDFTSPYELTLVPGCPPGLFTKQFAEFAPTASNATGFTNAAAGVLTTNYGSITALPPAPGATDAASNRAAQPFLFRGNTSPVEPHTFPYLIDKFFYTAANPPVTSSPLLPTDDLLYGSDAANPDHGTVDGYAADGWFKMFEFLEVPSQSAGSTGMVQNGTNFDWARQDARPGLLNLNLIIDEEVFFGLLGRQDSFGLAPYKQKLLNDTLVPTVDGLNAALGWSLTEYEGGLWATALTTGYPPIPMIVTATTADGGPAYVQPMENVGYLDYADYNPSTFPFATGLVPNAMKAAFAQFLWARHGGSGFLFGFGEGATGRNQTTVPAVITPPMTGLPAERPFRAPSFPDVDYTPMRPATLAPTAFTDPPANPAVPVNLNPVVDDPGVRNQRLFAGYERSTWAGSNATTTMLPPPIPARRLFQPADAWTWTSGGVTETSNAGLTASAYVNAIQPVNANPTIGGLPGVDLAGNPFGEGATNLFQQNAKLGMGGGSTPDMTQHPYFRSEQMQRITNLTTVRTHQFAVWVTVGFFEVIREGDIAMIGDPTYPTAAFDLLGPEIGAATGENTRYRTFCVVDRLKLTGFDPNAVDAYRPAVVYRRAIQ